MVSDGSEQSLSTLYEVLQIFCKASGMLINEEKSSLLHSGLDESELITLRNIFSFSVAKLKVGLKYLGFHLKPCRYLMKDWDWLVAKVEKRIKDRIFLWLFKGGKLILVKSVLESIPVFWMHLWIPLGIIEKIMKLCFKFLWERNSDSFGLPWTSWKDLACPKFLGGWGLKIPVVLLKH